MEDDIEFNPFYRALRTKFVSAYQTAQDRCHLICIPHSSTICGMDISAKFVEMHLLRNSPYFQGAFMTTDANNSGTVRIENGYLITAEGFNTSRKARILNEEIGYNSKYKTYRILLIDSPLWSEGSNRIRRNCPVMGDYIPSLIQLPKSPSFGNSCSDLVTVKIGFERNKELLESFGEHRKALSALDNKILLFNQNYVILKSYMQDAAQRLRTIWDEATDALLIANQHPLRSDPRFADTFAVAVESYLLGHVYDKVFPVLCEACQSNEAAIRNKLAQLEHITPAQLGVPEIYSCPLPAAVLQLEKLNGLSTPLEKMECLKITLDNITETVNAHASKTQIWSDKELPCITSDDLIPLLVCVVMEATSTHLEGNAQYIELFHWSTSSKDDFSYSFVTFKAALEYIKTVNVKTLNVEKTPVPLPQASYSTGLKTSAKNSSSPDSRKQSGRQSLSSEKSVEPGLGNHHMQPVMQLDAADAGSSSASDSPSSGRRRSSRLDRQYERINRMLDSVQIVDAGLSSGMNLPPMRPGAFGQRPRSSEGPWVSRQSSTNPALGDFLSSLQDDVMHSSFGKQT